VTLANLTNLASSLSNPRTCNFCRYWQRLDGAAGMCFVVAAVVDTLVSDTCMAWEGKAERAEGDEGAGAGSSTDGGKEQP